MILLFWEAIFTSIPFQLTQFAEITLIGRIGLRNPMSMDEYKKYLINYRKMNNILLAI